MLSTIIIEEKTEDAIDSVYRHLSAYIRYEFTNINKKQSLRESGLLEMIPIGNESTMMEKMRVMLTSLYTEVYTTKMSMEEYQKYTANGETLKSLHEMIQNEVKCN